MSARVPRSLLLFAGFYLFGLGLAAGLCWLPWAQVAYTGGIGPSGFIALVVAGYVAWALVPPCSRWAPPGPEVVREKEPRLHGLVEEVAAMARHPKPRVVYAVAGATAFASSRPLWFGLRREPVVGIGLPLFAVLTRKEMAAVVAHEFGHHVGGDVRLGPWQHRTFQAIAAALHRLDGSSLFLHLPFYAYGRLFLRLSGAASRDQELRADALAARLTSTDAIAGALVAVERHAPAWSTYWQDVFVPAINAGFLLPILEGYQRFAAATAVASAALVPEPPAPEDTHPPLDVRLASLGASVPLPVAADPPAFDLLSDIEGFERLVLGPLLADAAVLGRLKRTGWDAWGHDVLPAVWKGMLGARLGILQAVTLDQLPSLLDAASSWWERLHVGVNVFSPEARRRQLRSWLGIWVALCLEREGLGVASEPGAPLVLARGSLSVRPFQWVEELAAGQQTAAAWTTMLAGLRAHDAGIDFAS